MNWLRNFLYGRNGVDQLTVFSLILAAVFMTLAGITGITPLAFLYLACILYGLFRVLSRDIHNRRRENLWFTSIPKAVSGFFRLRIRMAREIKTHKYLKCPGCKTRLRVPKGKGNINITCTKCRESFVRKV